MSSVYSLAGDSCLYFRGFNHFLMLYGVCHGGGVVISPVEVTNGSGVYFPDKCPIPTYPLDKAETDAFSGDVDFTDGSGTWLDTGCL